jgi:hypothetical protein
MVSVIVVMVLELVIYLAAASQAGQKSSIVITDADGNRIYETRGRTLTSYEKMNFESTFGPLQDYKVAIQTESSPFPFRAWVTAAVGIPVGLILLMAFVIQVYVTLMSSEEESKGEENPSGADHFGSGFQLFNRISVYHIGAVTILMVLLLWMVPNFLMDMFKFGVNTFQEFKWFFLGAIAFVGFLVMWVIYLRYKLSKKMMENQLDLEKFRVERQLLMEEQQRPLLPHVVDNPGEDQKGMKADV